MSNSEHYDQIALDIVFPKSFHRFSALMVLATTVTCGRADDLLDLEGRHCVAQDVTHVGFVPIEAFEFIQAFQYIHLLYIRSIGKFTC